MVIKKALVAAAALVALPVAAQAQSLQYPGFYVGIEGGGNWMFNNNVTTPFGASGTIYPQIGWAAGGMIGYDFVGPRVEIEGVYRHNQATVGGGTFNAFGAAKDDIGVIANILYDFNAGGTIVPYIGAGAGVAFVRTSALGFSNDTHAVRLPGDPGRRLQHRPDVPRQPRCALLRHDQPVSGGHRLQQQQPQRDAEPAGASSARRRPLPPPPPPTAAAPSFMVFFDWDRSNLSEQALNTIRQAAAPTRPGATPASPRPATPTSRARRTYNMALSLRRANAVKDALVREGVPATAISVIGRGESQPLVQTADGVREPQNRRVEIVIQ